MKIDMNKKYRRVGTHEPVRVICVDAKGIYNVVSLQNNRGVEFCIMTDINGKCLGSQIIEEVPAVDWSKVEVDTLIWVNKVPRYFAEYGDNGLVFFFADGTTSKTNNNLVGYVRSEYCYLEEPK